MRTLFFILIATTVFASCKRGTAPVTPPQRCAIYGMVLLLSHEYSVEEIDTIYFAKYAAATGFADALELDTLTFADTFQLSAEYEIQDTYYPREMIAGYDYEVSVPATGQVFRIQNIQNPPDSMGSVGTNSTLPNCTAFTKDYQVTGGKSLMAAVWPKQYDKGIYGVVLGK